MEEIRDQMELANEISDVISQPVGGIEMDDVRTLKIAQRSSSWMKYAIQELGILAWIAFLMPFTDFSSL